MFERRIDFLGFQVPSPPDSEEDVFRQIDEKQNQDEYVRATEEFRCPECSATYFVLTSVALAEAEIPRIKELFFKELGDCEVHPAKILFSVAGSPQ